MILKMVVAVVLNSSILMLVHVESLVVEYVLGLVLTQLVLKGRENVVAAGYQIDEV